jgi:hypothetical protein
MIKYRINNIRDLFGHKVEMARTRTAPCARLNYDTGAAKTSKTAEQVEQEA